MTIYSKKGDKGFTTTPQKKKISKSDPIIEIYGTLDELNVALGTALAFVQSKKSKNILHMIQKQIFEINAHIEEEKPITEKAEIKRMENEIGLMEERLQVMEHFIIPGGTKGSCFIHQARIIARKIERRLSSIGASSEYLAYFNRLSDLLFVLARWENKEEGIEDEIWKEWEE